MRHCLLCVCVFAACSSLKHAFPCGAATAAAGTELAKQKMSACIVEWLDTIPIGGKEQVHAHTPPHTSRTSQNTNKHTHTHTHKSVRATSTVVSVSLSILLSRCSCGRSRSAHARRLPADVPSHVYTAQVRN